MDIHTKRYHVEPGQKIKIEEWDPGDTSGFEGEKEQSVDVMQVNKNSLESLQEILFAEHEHKILIVLQAMDTGGKDGVIRRVFEAVNPQGVRVVNFKEPSINELDHDYLWRVHAQVPIKGELVIFNRSHYEDVLIARVHELAPADVIEKRYQQIMDFERMLSEEGSTIMKFFLNISYDMQKKRLQDRLADPTKQWKFNINDLNERKDWKAYMKSYEILLSKTSTDWAPWYIIPSDHEWIRDLLISKIIISTLEKLDMHYPKLKQDPKTIEIS
ncbi:MAG: polyphosphate kinase 2 family protein [Candidatus Bathyarchaeia archaeon]|jgi:PPK2 family polyphosphate:nucleotide phosphotransferase